MNSKRNSELERLQFVEQRDGLEGALSFARQTLKVYWNCVKRKPGARPGAEYFVRPGYGNAYRRSLIEAIITLRKYISER